MRLIKRPSPGGLARSDSARVGRHNRIPADHVGPVPGNDIRAEAARLIQVCGAIRRSCIVRRAAGCPPLPAMHVSAYPAHGGASAYTCRVAGPLDLLTSPVTNVAAVAGGGRRGGKGARRLLTGLVRSDHPAGGEMIA